ncbi:MAG: hypothetical protein IJ767_06815 [Bacteroidaceae bacterium]|nr:hypothetical protein [Bacteroidaceae bacterium]MBR1801186.1 hypothetical protein [Bacteroidaceae bacterium]
MPSPNKRTSENEFVSCIGCQNAKALYQWSANPIVALCGIHGERQVAQARRICKLFSPLLKEQTPIRHFDHYPASKEELDEFLKQEQQLLHGDSSTATNS